MRIDRTWLLGCAILVSGCALAHDDADVDAPTLLAVSRAEVGVGQAVELIGTGYLTGSEGHTEIRLEGEYIADSGATYPIDMRIRPHWASGSRLVWANVGPFKVPFSPAGNELGVFQGTATPINVDPEGGEAHGEPLPMDLRIGPSVIVHDLQPVTGACQEPAKRLLGGFPYRITVEAVGLEPVNFTYELLNEPGLEGRPRVFRQPAAGQFGHFGDDGELFLPEVPEGQVFYLAELLITARAADGPQAATVFAFGVHRPVEYVDWGTPQIAEIHAPQPVSGCIAGGINGQMVRYTETDSEERTRQVQYRWDENWVQSHSSQYSTAHEERNGVSISYSQNQTYGWSANWQRSDSFSGGGGISINPLGF